MLHILHKKQEQLKSSPILGGVLPMMLGDKNNDGNSSDEEGDDKNPFAFMKAFDPKRLKKNKGVDPHLLPLSLFTFGVSLIKVNVRHYGEFEGESEIFESVPALRHALYANAIADGTANFIAGILYASYTQSKDFCAEVKKGDLTKFEFLGALVGLLLQGGVYGFYGAFAIPTIFFKLTTINKHKERK